MFCLSKLHPGYCIVIITVIHVYVFSFFHFERVQIFLMRSSVLQLPPGRDEKDVGGGASFASCRRKENSRLSKNTLKKKVFQKKKESEREKFECGDFSSQTQDTWLG